MRFLVDANLPRSVTALLLRLGHGAVDVRDIGMSGAHDDVIARHARQNEQILITRDLDVADILNYPPAHYAGIVVVKLPHDSTADQIAKLIEMFVEREEWLSKVSGRLAIVESWRVRFRPGD